MADFLFRFSGGRRYWANRLEQDLCSLFLLGACGSCSGPRVPSGLAAWCSVPYVRILLSVGREASVVIEYMGIAPVLARRCHIDHRQCRQGQRASSLLGLAALYST